MSFLEAVAWMIGLQVAQVLAGLAAASALVGWYVWNGGVIEQLSDAVELGDSIYRKSWWVPKSVPWPSLSGRLCGGGRGLASEGIEVGWEPPVSLRCSPSPWPPCRYPCCARRCKPGLSTGRRRVIPTCGGCTRRCAARPPARCCSPSRSLRRSRKSLSSGEWSVGAWSHVVGGSRDGDHDSAVFRGAPESGPVTGSAPNGLALHWVYYATGSLWGPVLLHFLNNGLAVLLLTVFPDWVDQAGKARGPQGELLLVSAAVVLGVALFLWETRRIRTEDEFERVLTHDELPLAAKLAACERRNEPGSSPGSPRAWSSTDSAFSQCCREPGDSASQRRRRGFDITRIATVRPSTEMRPLNPETRVRGA